MRKNSTRTPAYWDWRGNDVRWTWLGWFAGTYLAAMLFYLLVAGGLYVAYLQPVCHGGAKEKTAELRAKQLRGFVEVYYLMNDEQLPERLSRLAAGPDPLVKDEDKLYDPWGNHYEYRRISDDEFEVWSPGPDGEAWTDDDVGL